LLLVGEEEYLIDIIVWFYIFILQQVKSNVVNMFMKHDLFGDY
jgi:hypothetical protein